MVENEYAAEAEENWPEEFAASQQKFAALSEPEQQALFLKNDEISRSLAALFLAGEETASPQVQAQISEHYKWVCAFWTPNRDAYIGLGQLYVDDERFTATYDVYAKGLAAFICDAMLFWSFENLG
jgi:hypothetical protein